MTTVYPDLARAAVEGVGGWRYEPTLLHGVPVDTRITISVTFPSVEVPQAPATTVTARGSSTRLEASSTSSETSEPSSA